MRLAFNYLEKYINEIKKDKLSSDIEKDNLSSQLLSCDLNFNHKNINILEFEKLKKIKACGIFLEMGRGKTKLALDLMNLHISKNRIDKLIYLLPISVKDNIIKEFIKWYPEILEITEFYGIESIGMSDRIYTECWNNILPNFKTGIILDESIKIKNPQAKATKRILEMSKRCHFKIILNGTPISQSYLDLFTQIYFLSPNILNYKNVWEFYKNHFVYWKNNPHKVLEVKNAEWLVTKISPYIVTGELEIDTIKQDIKIECLMNSDEYEEYQFIRKKFLQELENPMFNKENKFYEFITALQKLSSCEDKYNKLKELINSKDEKFIIFTRYRFEAERIYKIYKDKALLYWGNLKKEEANKIKNDFQKERYKVLVMTLQTGSYSLNLQYCQNMVFFNRTFSYAVMKQSKGRIYRLGSKFKNVNYYYLITANSKFDNEFMTKVLDHKTDITNDVRKFLNKTKELKEWVEKSF